MYQLQDLANRIFIVTIGLLFTMSLAINFSITVFSCGRYTSWQVRPFEHTVNKIKLQYSVQNHEHNIHDEIRSRYLKINDPDG